MKTLEKVLISDQLDAINDGAKLLMQNEKIPGKMNFTYFK